MKGWDEKNEEGGKWWKRRKGKQREKGERGRPQKKTKNVEDEMKGTKTKK